MAMSTIEPKKVELIRLDNNNAMFRLRDNIIIKVVPNDLINTSTSFYIYDELDVHMTYVENIEQLINDSFSVYWNLATEQLANKKQLEEQKQQIKDLIENGKLLQVNEQQNKQILDTMELLISMMN